MQPRINPLSRRPRARRLVVGVRGGAGTGKSRFAASLTEAGLGRLCFFDTERKARLLKGSDGTVFDALEIQHPDELPEFIDWALEQDYGCYALDSWAMYFGRKHRETLEAVRRRTGDPLAQPTAEELQADQVIFQEVLRRLCVDSGACVVITDQIAAKGKETREENEMGRVLPMTASGLEYFVDVMLELEVRLDGFEEVRVARVIKSNSERFPVGKEFINPMFADLLEQLPDTAPPARVTDVPETLEEPAPPPPPTGPTYQDLLAKAEEFGVSADTVVKVAVHSYQQSDLRRLTPEQTKDLYDRLVARYSGTAAGPTASNGNGAGAAKGAKASNRQGTRSQTKAAQRRR
ncbi:MAG: ATP-binding protein [Ardenticatenaceae bacterium]|nr:ATP-binding protein [Ardenticatenaceae bacterium]